MPETNSPASDILNDVQERRGTKENRVFSTGATRSSDAGRYDPEGFLSPLALERFCEYMTKHRLQADGTLRDSDNWQKGMPLPTFIKGMWRHFLHLWQRHRGWTVVDPGASANIEEDLCAIIFNAQGYLHELIKTRRSVTNVAQWGTVRDQDGNYGMAPGDTRGSVRGRDGLPDTEPAHRVG